MTSDQQITLNGGSSRTATDNAAALGDLFSIHARRCSPVGIDEPPLATTAEPDTGRPSQLVQILWFRNFIAIDLRQYADLPRSKRSKICNSSASAIVGSGTAVGRMTMRDSFPPASSINFFQISAGVRPPPTITRLPLPQLWSILGCVWKFGLLSFVPGSSKRHQVRHGSTWHALLSEFFIKLRRSQRNRQGADVACDRLIIARPLILSQQSSGTPRNKYFSRSLFSLASAVVRTKAMAGKSCWLRSMLCPTGKSLASRKQPHRDRGRP